ncbi:MAG: DUF2974 domain-containing protein [Ruminococcus sp.]|nr:DUF2974 domain-containing protein [Ruminococcus sp.]
MLNTFGKNTVPGTAEMLLYLDILTYFPEFAHGDYETAGDFVREYLQTPAKKRPTTMFSGFCHDERSGVAEIMEKISRFDRLMKLKIAYAPSETDNINSLCFTEDTILPCGKIPKRKVYIIIGCNYRLGEYSCGGVLTNTWADNFLGAVQADTVEQQSILSFFDKAVAAAKKDLPGNTELSITVSGHSKAGNMAQYITILREEVNRCISFDGQGFSGRFVRKYREQILRRGSKIISICPNVSITGSLLHCLENVRTIHIKTAVLGEKGGHIIPLYYHIPVSVLDDSGKLRARTKHWTALNNILRSLSMLPENMARVLPLWDEERALKRIGTAIMRYFKGDKATAVCELLDPHALFLIAAGLIAAAVLAPFMLVKAIFGKSYP